MIDWTPGSWGKGFVSAAGNLYAWDTDGLYKHPNHAERVDLIDEQEGPGVVARAAAADEAGFAYHTPVVIGPEGHYTIDTNEPAMKYGHTSTEYLREAQAARFAQAHPHLKYVRDLDRWLNKVDPVPAVPKHLKLRTPSGWRGKSKPRDGD
jgi:hypothetical protein